MRASLSAALFLLLCAACGGGAQTNPNAPVSLPPAGDPSTPPPAASSAPPAASSAPAVAPAQAFCPNLGKIRFEGGHGTSTQDAIRILGAKGEMDGVASEYSCLDAAYGPRREGKWKLLQQSLLNEKGKSFDLMSVQLPDGTKVDVFFDISDYFGKF